EAELPVPRRHIVRAGERHQILLEDRAIRLVAGGVDVGEVVGDGLQLAAERDLARESEQKGILHPCLPRGATAGAALPQRRGQGALELSQASARRALRRFPCRGRAKRERDLKTAG